MTLLVIVIRKTLSATEQLRVLQDLSDAFIIPGVIVLCFAGLVFSSNCGTFDMLLFSISKVFDVFRKNENKRAAKNFYEYRESKSDEPKSFVHLIIIGIIFVVIGIVFYVLYSMAK